MNPAATATQTNCKSEALEATLTTFNWQLPTTAAAAVERVAWPGMAAKSA